MTASGGKKAFCRGGVSEAAATLSAASCLPNAGVSLDFSAGGGVLAPTVLAQGPLISQKFLDRSVLKGFVGHTERTDERHEERQGHTPISCDPAPYLGPPHIGRHVEFAP